MYRYVAFFLLFIVLFRCTTKKIEKPVFEALQVSISCVAECGDNIEFELTANKPIASQSWSGPNGYSGGIISDATDLDAGTYFVTVTDTDGCTAINDYTVSVNSCCTEEPIATCSFDGTALTINSENYSLPLLKDSVHWRKVDPNDNSIVLSNWEIYSAPLVDCDIKESFSVLWSGVSGCTESSSSGGSFIFNANTGLVGCQSGIIADWEMSFNGNIVSFSGATTGNRIETVASMQTNGPKTYQATYNSPLGPMVASGQYNYTGSGSSPNCADINWQENLIPQDLYYTIEYRRIIETAECGLDTIYGICEIGNCIGKSLNLACDASNITATVSGCSISAYEFYFNGSLLQTGASNTYSNPQSGTYTVVATCADGCVLSENITCSVPCSGSVAIAANGSCGLIISSLTGCSGSPTYQWYKDFSPISGATSASYNATENGSYYLQISGCSGCGTVASNSVALNSCSNPCDNYSVSINGPGTSTCQGDFLSFSANINGGSGPYTYQWALNGVNQTTNSTYSTSTLAPGTYTLSVLINDGNGCSDGDTYGFTVSDCTDPCDNYNVVIVAGSRNQTICTDETQLFQYVVFGGQGPYSTTWRLNGSVVSSGTTWTASGLTSGTYTVSVSVLDGNSCLDSYTTNLFVQECTQCLVNLSPNNLEVCEPETQGFTAFTSNVSSPVTYEWYVDGVLTSQQGASVQFGLNEGVYDISVNITDNEGCTSGDLSTLTVNAAFNAFVDDGGTLKESLLNVCANQFSYQIGIGASNLGSPPYGYITDSPRVPAASNIGQSGNIDISNLAPGEEVTFRFFDSNDCEDFITVSTCCQCDIVGNCFCTDPCNNTYNGGQSGIDNDDVFEAFIDQSGSLNLKFRPLSEPQTFKVYFDNVLALDAGVIVWENNEPSCGSTGGNTCPPTGTIDVDLACYSNGQSIPTTFMKAGGTATKEAGFGGIGAIGEYDIPISAGTVVRYEINHPGCTTASNWELEASCN